MPRKLRRGKLRSKARREKQMSKVGRVKLDELKRKQMIEQCRRSSNDRAGGTTEQSERTTIKNGKGRQRR